MAGGHEVSLPGRTLMHVGAMYRDIHTNFFNCEPLLSSPEAWSCKNEKLQETLQTTHSLVSSRIKEFVFCNQSIKQSIISSKECCIHTVGLRASPGKQEQVTK